MKVKVIKKFLDANTKELHTVGEELEVTNERYKEICKVGNFVEVIKKTTRKESAE